MKYRKKPLLIEAIEWTGNNREEVYNFAGNKVQFAVLPDPEGNFNCVLDTLEGHVVLSPHTMIIRGIIGEIYSCRKDIFDKTYEEVKDGE